MKVAACRADEEGRCAPCAHTVAPGVPSVSLKPLTLTLSRGERGQHLLVYELFDTPVDTHCPSLEHELNALHILE